MVLEVLQHPTQVELEVQVVQVVLVHQKFHQVDGQQVQVTHLLLVRHKEMMVVFLITNQVYINLVVAVEELEP